MNQPFIGPIPIQSPDPDLPAQPKFSSWCVGWGAYDVPRINEILRPENDELGWEQARGFRYLALLLIDQYARIRTRRDQLADVWQSPAAEILLSKIDGFSRALLSDAYCASTTSSALDAIMNTYKEAQIRVSGLQHRWNRVTGDCLPEWWDNAAAELNKEAQSLMFSVDDSVRDHRSRIIIPSEFLHVASKPSESGSQPIDDQPSPGIRRPPDGTAHVSSSQVVPPIPGYRPIQSNPGTGAIGEGLAGMPKYTPAAPGQPVSMLPIPPGNTYAPYGGAYVLPGPGVGPQGYVVAMPNGGVGTPPYRPAAMPAAGTTNTNGTPIPIAFGTPPGNASQGNSRIFYRRGPIVWTVETGGPHIISAPHEDQYIPDLPSPKQEAAFMDWFTQLAYPWRTGERSRDSEPTVVFRRTAE